MDPDVLRQLSKDYRGLVPSGHKQMGVRSIGKAREAARRGQEEQANRWQATAAYHLPYAKAIHEAQEKR